MGKNWKRFALFGALAAMLCCWGAACSLQRPVPIGAIETFRFTYSTAGAVANASVEYALRLENGTYIATVKPDGLPPEAATTYPVEEAFARSLEALLREGGVSAWNGFDRDDPFARDGTGFSLYVTMADGTAVEARGYMKWPKGYAQVKGDVSALFDALAH